MQDNASIVCLRIKNLLGISDVEIKPGQINQIVGRNNMGKTTILKALGIAAEGTTDGAVVKNGEDVAEVLVELSDGTNIHRRIRSDGKQSLTVSKGDFKITAPQSYLDALFDKAAFNPLDLLEPKSRNEAIMNAIPLRLTPDALAELLGYEVKNLPPVDFAQHGLKVIDAVHRYFYQRRAEANRVVAEKKKRWETYLSDYKPVDAPPLDREQLNEAMTETKQQLTQARSDFQSIRKQEEANQKLAQKTNQYKFQIEAIEKDLLALKSDYEKRKAVLEGAISITQGSLLELSFQTPAELPSDIEVKEKIEALQNTIHELEIVGKNIDSWEATERQHRMIKDMENEYTAAQAFSEALSKRVQLLGGPLKASLLETVEMPINGLEYVEGEFLLDGIKVDNLSSSRAIKLAIALARKHAKKSKVICVDGAEALDPDTLTNLISEISDDGYTYFLTKVGEPLETGVQDSRVFRMQDGELLQ